MAIWDKVKEGIDKAGKAAQEAFDDGKTRIDAYRAREQADKAAESLGYAVFRAAEEGRELEDVARQSLMQTLRERDAEARRLEAIIANTNTVPPTPDAPPPPPEPAPAPEAAEPVPPPPNASAGPTPPYGQV
ncbi:MAG: hypothetical protein ACO1Q7_05335 [Gemmatimonas sp.]